MKKVIVSLAMAMVFAFCAAGTSFAAKINCTVDAVDGDKVTMTCEKADKLAPGDKVKVSPAKKGAAVEGC
jgi:hypothetical protein